MLAICVLEGSMVRENDRLRSTSVQGTEGIAGANVAAADADMPADLE